LRRFRRGRCFGFYESLIFPLNTGWGGGVFWGTKGPGSFFHPFLRSWVSGLPLFALDLGFLLSFPVFSRRLYTRSMCGESPSPSAPPNRQAFLPLNLVTQLAPILSFRFSVRHCPLLKRLMVAYGCPRAPRPERTRPARSCRDLLHKDEGVFSPRDMDHGEARTGFQHPSCSMVFVPSF